MAGSRKLSEPLGQVGLLLLIGWLVSNVLELSAGIIDQLSNSAAVPASALLAAVLSYITGQSPALEGKHPVWVRFLPRRVEPLARAQTILTNALGRLARKRRWSLLIRKRAPENVSSASP